MFFWQYIHAMLVVIYVIKLLVIKYWYNIKNVSINLQNIPAIYKYAYTYINLLLYEGSLDHNRVQFVPRNYFTREGTALMIAL